MLTSLRGWLEEEKCRENRAPCIPLFLFFNLNAAFICRRGLRFTVFRNPFCRKEVRWKGSGKPECTLQLLRIKYCLLHSRLKDHERVTVFACYYGLCPILTPCTNKDNDGDTTCLFSYMFSSPQTFQWSEHQNLRSRHWWTNMMVFLRCGSWSVKDGVPFQVLIYLCNAADIIYSSNGKPHDSAEPKSALAWELQAAICPSRRRTRHKPFCALRYQPLQFPLAVAPLFTLMSHGVCHPIHAASRVACRSKSLCWHQVQYLEFAI